MYCIEVNNVSNKKYGNDADLIFRFDNFIVHLCIILKQCQTEGVHAGPGSRTHYFLTDFQLSILIFLV